MGKLIKTAEGYRSANGYEFRRSFDRFMHARNGNAHNPARVVRWIVYAPDGGRMDSHTSLRKMRDIYA